AKKVWAKSSVGRRIQFTGNDFIFSAGTIANSRFFLTSQRLYDVPWKNNSSIGTYYQDHLAGKIADVDIVNERRLRNCFENGFVKKTKLQPKLRFTPSARKQISTGVCGFFRFDSRI